MQRLVIAIDGYAASGKGTLARRIAGSLGLRYLETGLLYRAVGAIMADRNLDINDEKEAFNVAKNLGCDSIDDTSLRGSVIGRYASRVAAHPGVREALLGFQRDFACGSPGAVLDGRDIGTVVCPDASVKFFVTADLDDRVRRRLKDLVATGCDVDYDTVREDIESRDHLDANRCVAPLRPASGAHVLNTSLLDRERTFDTAMVVIMAAIGAESKDLRE